MTHAIQGRELKFKDPVLYFMDLRFFPLIPTHEKKKSTVTKNTCQLQMVSTCENHDPLVQTRLMQLTEGNYNLKTQCCILRTSGISH